MRCYSFAALKFPDSEARGSSQGWVSIWLCPEVKWIVVRVYVKSHTV